MFHLGTLLKGLYSHTQQCVLVRFITGLAVAAQPLQEQEHLNKMEAWQIHSYGDVTQLQLEPAAVPYITESNQLLIKVKATGLNPIDLAMLGGYGKSLFGLLRWYKTEFPLVLGREFAGTVVNKGRCVTDDEFKIGDDVYGIIPVQKQGCQTQYLLADKSHVLMRPSHLSDFEAASVLYASITAWSALFSSGGLSVGSASNTKVLILGISGGVGTVATQILKSQNVTVVGVCSADAIPLVTSLGADHAYNYKDSEHVLNVAAHGTYDVILDCAKYGTEKLPNDWKYKTFVTLNSPLLNNTDRFGLLGGLTLSAGELICANAPQVLSGKSFRWGFFSPQPAAFKFLDDLIKNKRLKPVIQKVFKFSEVPEAFNMLKAGHLRGKIVIDVQQNKE